MKITAYEATIDKNGTGVWLMSTTPGDSVFCKVYNWQEASEFLTDIKEDNISIVWSLPAFTKALFTLLPEEAKQELAKSPRVSFFDTHKIFYVSGRLLGISNMIRMRGNTYRLIENNIYQIKHWLSGIEAPTTLLQVAGLGEQILEALEELGIHSNKLTSPVNVYEQHLDEYDLPTLWSSDSEELIDASNYCSPNLPLPTK